MLDFNKISNLLEKEGAKWIAEIQANMIAEGVNASGETSESLQSVITKTVDGVNFQIIGNEAFNWIETGRGKSNKSQGGALLPRIKKWIVDKGLQIDDDDTIDSLAYRITKTIHAEGTLAYRLGERREIFSPVFSDLEIDRITKVIEVEVGEQVETTFFKHWSSK
jgi:hypothetical protein